MCQSRPMHRSKRRLYSITLSASVINGGGMVTPSALAALRLMTNVTRLLDWQVSRLGTLENLVDVNGGALVHVLVTRSIGRNLTVDTKR
jgi:hypothetical protein